MKEDKADCGGGSDADLSVPEKILRVQDLWDQIARSPAEVQLSREQLEELDRRLAAYDADPGRTIPWEDIRRDLEARV